MSVMIGGKDMRLDGRNGKPKAIFHIHYDYSYIVSQYFAM